MDACVKQTFPTVLLGGFRYDRFRCVQHSKATGREDRASRSQCTRRHRGESRRFRTCVTPKGPRKTSESETGDERTKL